METADLLLDLGWEVHNISRYLDEVNPEPCFELFEFVDAHVNANTQHQEKDRVVMLHKTNPASFAASLALWKGSSATQLISRPHPRHLESAA